MKTRSVVLYSVLRLAAFLVPLAVLLLAGVVWWISAPLAALFGLAFSFIFLRQPREEVATAIYDARHPAGPVTREDEETEDAFVDATDAARSTPLADRGPEGDAQADADHE